MTVPARFNFNGGEIAEELRWRSDIDGYHNSCLSAENTLIEMSGMARKRPGTRAVKKLATGTPAVRLLPFRFSVGTNYILVFIERSGAEAPDGDGVYLEILSPDGTEKSKIITPYTADQIGDIQFAQSYDVVFLVHGDVHPQKLSRVRDDVWLLEKMKFRGGPFQPVEPDPCEDLKFYSEAYIEGEEYHEGDIVEIPPSGSTGDPLNSGEDVVLDPSSVLRTEVEKIGDSSRITYEFVAIEFPTDETLPGTNWPVTIKGTAHNDGFFMAVDWQTSPRNVIRAVGPYRRKVFEKYTSGVGWSTVATEDNFGDFVQETVGTASIYKWFPMNGYSMDLYRAKRRIPAGHTYDAGDWEFVGTTGQRNTSRVAAVATPGIFGLSDTSGGKFQIVGDQETSQSGEFRWFQDVNGGTIGLADDVIESKPNLQGEYSLGVQTTEPVAAYGTVELTTQNGAWRGVLHLEESQNGGETWESIAVMEADGSRNFTLEREITNSDSLVRLRMERMGDNAGADEAERNRCVWFLNVLGDSYNSFDIVASVGDGGFMVVMEPENFVPLNEDGKKYRYATGYFGDGPGYPRAVAVHEERLYLASTPTHGTTLWGSLIDDWEEWQISSFDNSPVDFTLSSSSLNRIVWIMPRTSLVIGTEAGEWSINNPDQGKALGPANAAIQRHTQYGSAAVQAEPTANVIAFVQRGGGKVRLLQYSLESDSFESVSTTEWARHITESGVKEIVQATTPDSCLFIVRNDGIIGRFLFSQEQGVVGWTRLIFGDGVKSITTTPGDVSDYLWLAVERSGDLYLESFWSESEHYVDCAVGTGEAPILTGPGAKAYDGPHELGTEDYTLDPAFEVSGFTPRWTPVYGVPYDFVLHPTPVRVGDVTHGKRLRISGVTLYLNSATGGSVSVNDRDPVQLRVLPAGQMYSPPGATTDEPASGVMDVNVHRGSADYVDVRFTASGNEKLELCAYGLDLVRTEG